MSVSSAQLALSGVVLLAVGGLCRAQDVELAGPVQAEVVLRAELNLPDAPVAAWELEAAASQTERGPEQSQRQIAEQQIKEQQKQRVLGIFPMFNTSYVNDAATLSAGQKMRLALRTAIDPVSFAGAAVIAGLGELGGDDNNNGFGWGAGGYAKRWGAAYLDSFNGTMIGNGMLPSFLRQDPRYFRLGRGSKTRRVFYSMAASTVICRHDNSRGWEPNYSNIGGNVAAGMISNAYYPSTGEREGWMQTLTSALIVTAQGAAGGIFQEFWPDFSRKFLNKDPTRGKDAAGAVERKTETAEK